MPRSEHELLCKIMKMKSPLFLGSEMEDSFEFIMDCHVRLHKMGTVEQHELEFVIFKLQGDAM